MNDVYLFPKAKIQENAKFVIYGAGEIGKRFLAQIEHFKIKGFCYFVDQKFDFLDDFMNHTYGVRVKSSQHLFEDKDNIDYIIVATVIFKEEVVEQLKEGGIPEDKLILINDEDIFPVELKNRYIQSGNFPSNKITFSADGLITIHNFNFAYDEKFQQALRKQERRMDWLNSRPWRTYNACWCAHYASHLDGDFIECGVRNAVFSSAIIDYIDFSSLDKKFYLVDTFEGLVESMLNENEKGRYYKYDESVYVKTKEYFSQYSNVEIVKGIVPDILPMVKAEKIAYLSLDMNCAYPEIEALKYFWNKLVSGAVIIMDDYAYRGYEFQMKEMDAFAKSKNIKILNLACGQGMMIKP